MIICTISVDFVDQYRCEEFLFTNTTPFFFRVVLHTLKDMFSPRNLFISSSLYLFLFYIDDRFLLSSFCVESRTSDYSLFSFSFFFFLGTKERRETEVGKGVRKDS